MEEMTEVEIIKLARDAYTMAAEVFNLFHNAVKKTAKPKVSLTDPTLTNKTQYVKKTTHATSSKAKVKSGNRNSEIDNVSAKNSTTPSKNAKKERRQMKVQERELVKADIES